MPVLRYEEFEPAEALRPNVACYWAIQGQVGRDTPAVNRVLPDTCMDVIFDFGEGRPVPVAARAMVVGAMRQALVVEHRGRVDLLGVRFRPGGAVPLLGVPAFELTDLTAGLDDFWGDAAQVVDRVGDIGPGATRSRIARLEALLLERLGRSADPDPLIRVAMRSIRQAAGTVPVGHLETSLGIGSRTLERRFLSGVGISPKAAARIVRMQAAAEMLRSGANVSLAAVAVLAGFHDQAHFTRDFGRLAGTTPAVFAREAGVGFVQDETGPAA